MSVSTVATLQPATALFREEQYFDWRVYALIAMVEALTAMGVLHSNVFSTELLLGLAIGMCMLIAFALMVLRMTTEVTATEVCVWIGWVPLYRKAVPLENVRSARPVAFRPIADYGFWGVRNGRDGERALIARGNRGVRVLLADGSILIIGSQRSEELAVALQPHVPPLA